MANYSTILNGDTGLQARTKINDVITHINNTSYSATASTSNGTPATVATVDFTGLKGGAIKISAFAYDQANNLGYGSELFGVFKNLGTFSQVSSTDSYIKTDFSTASLGLSASGQSVSIVATGEASKNINWVVNYSITKLS